MFEINGTKTLYLLHTKQNKNRLCQGEEQLSRGVGDDGIESQLTSNNMMQQNKLAEHAR